VLKNRQVGGPVSDWPLQRLHFKQQFIDAVMVEGPSGCKLTAGVRNELAARPSGQTTIYLPSDMAGLLPWMRGNIYLTKPIDIAGI